jgi:hypothetical protein
MPVSVIQILKCSKLYAKKDLILMQVVLVKLF